MQRKGKTPIPNSVIKYFGRSHTIIQSRLNDLVLMTFRVYSHKGVHDNHIISLHQKEVIQFMALTEAQTAIETMVSKSVLLIELVEEQINVLHEIPLYNSITFYKDVFWFETNPAIKPYWVGIFRGLDDNMLPYIEREDKIDWKNL